MEQNKDHYQSPDQKPYTSFYLRIEQIIDHPVEKVWPQALNIGSWMNAHQLTTIAGQSGEVGHFQRVNPRGLGDEVPEPHHHLYTITQIIPNKLIAYEVFPERGGSYGKTWPRMTFDSMHFTDIGGKTQIVYWLVDVHLVKTDPELCARRNGELENVRKVLEGFFDNLRLLLAKGS